MKTFYQFHIYLIACIFLLCVFALPGCEEKTEVLDKKGNSHSPPSPQDDLPPIKNNDGLHFQLSKGWEIHPETSSKARWPNPSKDGKIPYVVLEFTRSFDGDEKSAQVAAKESAEENKKQCSFNSDCTITPSYEELQLGEYTMYAALGENFSWGESSWRTQLYFVKNGRVMVFTLDDRPEYYKEALQQLVETLTF